jgi:hypothetical protein
MTREEMRAIDESPSYSSGSRIHFFREQGNVEHRSAVRPRRFPRRERAQNLNRIHQWILEKEEHR